MKNLLLLLIIAISINCYSQKRTYGIKECKKEDKINLINTQILLKISGLIEIDGHTFLNDTCADPVMFKADINGISIHRLKTRVKYTYNKCNKSGCDIIHLEEKLKYNSSNDNFYFNTYPGIILDSIRPRFY